LELNGGRPPWSQFIQLVNARFGLPLTDTPLGELAMLRRTGSVDEFAKRFMALSCRDPTITEQQQIQLFTTGLGDPLRLDVALQQPSSMDDAVIFAQAYEQRLASHDVGTQPSTRGVGRVGTRTAPQTGVSPATTPAAFAKPSSAVKRLTVAEIAERRKDGSCFHCDEPFTNGHKMVCKQLFTIELIHDDEPLATGDELDPTISIHALVGIEPRSDRTMKVKVIINAVALTALLDSGSTHNFVDMDAATRAGLQLTPRGDLRVAVANGDRVSSPGSCCNISISIGGEVFSIDCYELALGAYDMVLRVQWLESLGSILWDFGRRTMAFVRHGHRVLWQTTKTPPASPVLMATDADLMGDLLDNFTDLFVEPSGLPPPRDRCHEIRLLPGTPPVVVRPY
jgi:hypothetical protein